MRDYLRALHILRSWHAEILARADALLESEQAMPRVDVDAIDAQLKRLGMVYADGLLSEVEYARSRDALRAQRTQADVQHERLDLAKALDLLSEAVALVDATTVEEQCGLVRQSVSHMWADYGVD
jgi:uncharacterized protein YqgQ